MAALDKYHDIFIKIMGVTDLNKIQRDAVEELTAELEKEAARSFSKKYYALRRDVPSTLIALAAAATVIFAFFTGIKLDATKQAQIALANRIGQMSADGSLERIEKAAEETKKGSGLDQLSSLSQSNDLLRSQVNQLSKQVEDGASSTTQRLNADDSRIANCVVYGAPLRIQNVHSSRVLDDNFGGREVIANGADPDRTNGNQKWAFVQQ